MNCDDTHILLHALIDGELDAGNARDVETHIASCPSCAERFRDFRDFRAAMAPADLRYSAPAKLRARIEGKLPAAQAAVAIAVRCSRVSRSAPPRARWRRRACW